MNLAEVPKCIVHGAGGALLQHLKEHKLHCDVKPGDKLFYFTTCGWMMWNWLVSGLASGATVMLYDGAPLAPESALWDFAAEERIERSASRRCVSRGLAPSFSDAARYLALVPKWWIPSYEA